MPRGEHRAWAAPVSTPGVDSDTRCPHDGGGDGHRVPPVAGSPGTRERAPARAEVRPGQTLEVTEAGPAGAVAAAARDPGRASPASAGGGGRRARVGRPLEAGPGAMLQPRSRG